MPNLQLERLAAKPQAIQAFTLPPFPRLPVWFSRQFKLEDYEAEMDRWRQVAQTGIREALQQVQAVQAVQSQNE